MTLSTPIGYIWDGNSGTPAFAIRHWAGRYWDEPNLVRIAHPSTIEQGG
jgi:hypothetical protein